MAEIEFSVLSRAGLKGRNPDTDALHRAITAYETRRNTARIPINWRSEPTMPGSNSIVSTSAFSTLTEY